MTILNDKIQFVSCILTHITLGMHFKVEDPKAWSLAVEVCFGALLYNFCCHDQHDTKALRDVFKRVIPDNQIFPGIITAKFEVHITLDPRLPFPDSVGGIFLVQPLLNKSIRVLNGFPAGRATMIDSFEHVD